MADVIGNTKVYVLQRALDPRLVQVEELYTVVMGADAIQQMEQSVQTPSSQSMTWMYVPPSPGSVIQRSPLVDVSMVIKFYVQQTPGCKIGGPLAKVGRDWAIAAAAPFGRLVQNWNIQINGANVSQNNMTLLDLLHLLDTSVERANRACTWRNPVYVTWDEADGTTNGLGSMAGTTMDGDAPPGAYEITYLKPNPTQGGGAAWVPVSTAGYDSYTTEGVTVTCFNGIPIATPDTMSGAQPQDGALENLWVNSSNPNAPKGPFTNTAPIPIFFSVRFIDPVLCPPFGYAYMDSFTKVGMHGLSGIQFTAQLVPAVAARLIQGCAQHGVILFGPNCLTWASKPIVDLTDGTITHFVPGVVQAFENTTGQYDQAIMQITKSSLRFTALAPPINAELNPTNVLPLCNITYYPQTIQLTLPSQAWNMGDPLPPVVINFNAVTFPAVPDIIMTSMRPSYLSQTPDETDWQWNLSDNAMAQCNFANNPAVYSGWRGVHVVQTSRKNGVRAGVLAAGGVAGTGYFMSNGRKCIAAGAPMLMRPGVDFPLPIGVVSGSTGQVQFNAVINALATGHWDKLRQYNILVTALCKGYFITTGGSSRSFNIGLNEQAVMGAPRGVDTHSTAHLVGGALAGGGWQDLVGGIHQAINTGRRVWNTWKAAQPHVMSAINSGREAWNAHQGGGLGRAIRG